MYLPTQIRKISCGTEVIARRRKILNNSPFYRAYTVKLGHRQV